MRNSPSEHIDNVYSCPSAMQYEQGHNEEHCVSPDKIKNIYSVSMSMWRSGCVFVCVRNAVLLCVYYTFNKHLMSL